VLRFWAIDLGLPNTGARPDERELLVRTAGFATGDLNPHWFIYPPLYFHLVWAWDEMLLAVRRLWVATPSYATMVRDDLPTLILYGRLQTAAIGTASVAVLWVCARRVGGRGLGLLAALLLAANFLHARDSHALKGDVPLALGVLGCVAYLARYVEAPGIRRIVAAAVVAGLTTGVKYTGILLLAPTYLATALASSRRGLMRLWPTTHMVVATVVVVGTFLATSPHLLLDFERTAATVRQASFNVYADHSRPTPAAPAWRRALAEVARRAWTYHAAVSLRCGAGLLFALATPFALALALGRPHHPLLLLAAAFSLFFYALAGASSVRFARHFTPIVPLLCLLVANLVLALARRVAAPRRASAAVVLAAALIAEPLWATIAHNRIAARTDTRVLATRWMAAHLPAGSVVAMLGSAYFPIADPDLPPGLSRPTLRLGETDLARHGVTHVLTHEHPLPFSNRNPAQMRVLAPHLRLLVELSPFRDGPAGVYEDFDAYYIPIHGFRGVERPGPLIRVYAYTAAP
jgi:hypothetical protein